MKTNQLMMYKAKVAVCSDIRTKHSTQRGRHVEFLMLNLVVRIETAKVKVLPQKLPGVNAGNHEKPDRVHVDIYHI